MKDIPRSFHQRPQTRSQKFFVLTLIGAFFLSGAQLVLSSDMGVSAEYLWQKSDLVGFGKVISARVEMVNWPSIEPDGSRLDEEGVMTIYTFAMSRVLKGNFSGDVIDVHTLGGKMDDYEATWSTGVSLEPYTELVLFLNLSEGAQLWYIHRGRSGVFLVRSQGAKKFVEGMIDNSHLIYSGSELTREEFIEKRNNEVTRRVFGND